MSKQKPTDLVRMLRRNQTDAERKLWAQLRILRAEGTRFRRQHPIGPYIVDFVCLEKKLVFEADGGRHNEPDMLKQDTMRTAWLEREGYHVLRFWNNDVLLNMDGVMIKIREALDNQSPSS
jgi:very-short-patch-repair endonuclease